MPEVLSMPSLRYWVSFREGVRCRDDSGGPWTGVLRSVYSTRDIGSVSVSRATDQKHLEWLLFLPTYHAT